MVVGTEWMWEALLSCRHAHEVVRQLAPEDFDWNCVHPIHGTPLMATVNEIVRSGDVCDDVRSVLLWCLRQGADPRRTAPRSLGYSGGWGNGSGEFPNVARVPHMHRSAITVCLGLIRVLEKISVYEHQGKYRKQLCAAKQLLSVFSHFRATLPSQPVARETVSMWKRIMVDEERADVRLHALGHGQADGLINENHDVGSGVVPAHSLVLSHLSPVLRATLSSTMREGQTQVVPVPEASVDAVKLLMVVLYSGILPRETAEAMTQEQRSLARDLKTGDAVEANFRGLGQWWPGRISGVHDDGTFDIIYDGRGSYSDWRVQRTNVRLPKNALASKVADVTSEPGKHALKLLTALDVAHRWQVSHAVGLLEQALVQIIERTPFFDEDFAGHERMRIFEHFFESAVLKNLCTLRTACRQYAEDSLMVRQFFHRGSFAHVAQRELESVYCAELTSDYERHH
eukprot:TRINITY_DN21424_c0_g1_i1.p1 TRINITY_DN21424_c0_g1~~TRINITY_DN21424_c0_g1_i1.p1  ORF type:complete len:512 (+),score=60.50 TRINITY_DN21424_c0_g1_i1:166-1536(+)